MVQFSRSDEVMNSSYLTVGKSRILEVMSWASGQYFSTSCSMSHSSFLGPSKPWKSTTICMMQHSTIFGNERCEDFSEWKKMFTFLGRKPCLSTCSSTMKKCWRGMWSESNIRPYFNEVSISSLTMSFDILTKLLRSIITGSRATNKYMNFLLLNFFMY